MEKQVKKTDWYKTTKKQMKDAGTYTKMMEPAIKAAAIVLEQRDAAYQKYIDDGAEPVVEYTSDRGATNMKQNPLLDVWLKLDKQSLEHWKSLGLTLESLNKITDNTGQQASRLADAIESLSKG